MSNTELHPTAANMAAIGMAVDREMAVRIHLNSGESVVLHPHLLAWSQMHRGHYVVDGKKLYWIHDIAKADLLFIETYHA